MTRIGWLADQGKTVGGAELTHSEFRAAAPEGVEIVDCPPGDVADDCDVYVVHNCVLYDPPDFAPIAGKPAFKYWHDVGPWIQDGVRPFLARMRHICCSPIQADYMRLPDAATIPPPVDLDRFRRAAALMNGDRAGIVSVGSWRNYGKAPHKAAEWASRHGDTVDFYGGGVFAPPTSREIAYQGMPRLLAKYQTFVFLPTVIEPFGRLVAEAWAAGCEIVTNNLVGAKWWIENDPHAMDTAADDFWRVIL